MEKIKDVDTVKQMAKKINIIMCGLVRDIADHFLSSFSILDQISEYFNEVFIIVLENDSVDSTKQLLTNWLNNIEANKKVKRHVIFLESLMPKYKYRTARLAHCRNIILDYIFDNNLNEKYDYLFNCDLDDVFWKLNINSVFSCFQYDQNLWDCMGCINANPNRIYYDGWALRLNDKVYDKNLFCKKLYSSKFIRLGYLKKMLTELNSLCKNNNLIEVMSCFNGFAIYKIKSLENCRYSNNCVCKNLNCEECEHINFHNEMLLKNSAKIFINTNFIVYKNPNFNNYRHRTKIYKYAKTYYDFLKNQINKLDRNDKSINEFIMYDDSNVCLIFGDPDVFSVFDINKFSNKKNIILSRYQENDILLKNLKISHLFINYTEYFLIDKIFNLSDNKILDGCIIIFYNIIIESEDLTIDNLNRSILGFRAFYEFLTINDVEFEQIHLFNTFDSIDSTKFLIFKILKNNYNNKHY